MFYKKSFKTLYVVYDITRKRICALLEKKKNRSQNSKITFRGFPPLTLACAGLFEHRRSGLGLLKSKFNAKSFIRKLF